MKTTLLLFAYLALAASGFAQSALSVKGGPAKLMSAPAVEATLIVEIPPGGAVELIRSEEGSDWLYVSFKEFRGWVLKSQVAEGLGDPQRPGAEFKTSSEGDVLDDHIAAVVSKSPKSVRDRGLTELKDLRSEARGDLDGDGDEDVVAAYSLGIGTEPRSTHIAVFEKAGERYRLLLDERLAAGTVVHIAGIFNRKLQIEVSGIVREFEVVAGRLTPAENPGDSDRNQNAESEVDTDRVTAAEGEEPVAVSREGESAAVPADVPGTVSKGVLNGSAIDLPKPAYPAAARAVGAKGTVGVAVVVDENGNVISASATSGHPLLRSSAVEAARQARFNPTLVDGVAVQISGVIIYNFQ